MPNPINPDDYNIDKLNTGFLGPILTTDFRNYILGFNLDDINSNVVSFGYNIGGLGDYVGDEFNTNPKVQDLPSAFIMADTPVPLLGNKTPWESNQIMNLWGTNDPYSYQIGKDTIQTSPSQNKKAYVVQPVTPLSDPGSVSIWTNGVGESSSVGVMTDMVNQSTYGPDVIKDYTDLTNVQSTGFVQYKTFAGGDFRSTILGQQLGFGAGAGIEFDSKLSDIGKEQRKFNVKERIKLNFIGDTLGKINADPLGLLAGQDLITRDYTITQGPGFGGKALEFTQSLLGFNIPTSIIPSWKSAPGNDGEDISTDLLNYTAGGTKTLLFNAIELNKWGPNFAGNEKLVKEKGKVGKFIEKVDKAIDQLGGSGQPPSSMKYTDVVETTTQIEDSREGSGDSLVEKLNKGVKNLVDGLIAGQEDPTIPTEFINPGTPTNPIDGNEAYGFRKGYNLEGEDDLIQEYYDGDTYGSKSNKFVTQNDINIGSEAPLTSDGNLFYWDKNRTSPVAKRGLLNYTQKLIQKTGNHGGKYIGIVNSQENVNTNKDNRHKLFSQGNRITKGEGDDKVYCRSWSVRNPYSKIEDTIRHRQSTKSDILRQFGVLEDNGMPKIVPYYDEYSNWTKGLHTNQDPSKYMLSIENLAWQNTREFNALPNVEKGPHAGRIMWFPPYDINFTDNSSVNWESTQFIGRGEPIYTYNNTERTGTLSFTIITDHPSSLNALRLNTKANLERYFAGCEDLSDTAFGDVDGEDIPEPPTVVKPKPINPPTGPTPTLSFYFENSSTTGKKDPGRNVYTDLGQGYETGGLNSTFLSDLKTMIDFLLTENGKRYRIISEGFTSALNVSSYNEVLGKDRATSLREYLTDKLVDAEVGLPPVKYQNSVEGKEKNYPTEIMWSSNSLRWSTPVSRGEVSNSGQNGPIQGNQTPEEIEAIVNDPIAKKARRATIRLEYNPNIDSFMLERATNDTEELNKQRQAEYNRKQLDRQAKIDAITEKLAREMVNESTYFNKMEVEDSFVFDSLREKVKFFHPAFHSMTPEGLNSRLTFLKQCTRQGPNINVGEPQNMAFGKPPICVLRIGDFYHTKIVIDSVNLSYEPLLWDLNPEGIGVQPMIAKVDLNFKFIGGSSIGGPITELQNAVSFNFFANTSVYNRRKNVTIKSKEQLKGRDVIPDKNTGTYSETFEYGSYISPNQKKSTIENSEINLDKRDSTDDLIEDDLRTYYDEVTEKGKTDPKLEETKKAVEEAGDFEEEAKKSSVVVKWVNIGKQYGGGSKTIVEKTTVSIIDEEKDNWDIIAFEVDVNGVCYEGEGITLGVSSDSKSATYSDYEGNIEACAATPGKYNYVFRVYVNSKNTDSNGNIEQRIYSERVTNTI